MPVVASPTLQRDIHTRYLPPLHGSPCISTPTLLGLPILFLPLSSALPSSTQQFLWLSPFPYSQGLSTPKPYPRILSHSSLRNRLEQPKLHGSVMNKILFYFSPKRYLFLKSVSIFFLYKYCEGKARPVKTNGP